MSNAIKKQFWEEAATHRGNGEIGLVLHERDDGAYSSIISISVTDGGNIKFLEECDGYFSRTETPQDAIKMLKEAIEWIECKMKGEK